MPDEPEEPPAQRRRLVSEQPEVNSSPSPIEREEGGPGSIQEGEPEEEQGAEGSRPASPHDKGGGRDEQIREATNSVIHNERNYACRESTACV